MRGIRRLGRQAPMTTGNTTFLARLIGAQCGELQYLRELTENAVDAGATDVVWDLDDRTVPGVAKLCVTDNGVGMSGPELERAINQLAVGHDRQSFEQNFGIGAKVTAAVQHPAGVIYLSWQNGAGVYARLYRDPRTGTFGLEQFRHADGRVCGWRPVDPNNPAEAVPALVAAGGSGTRVVLLGRDLTQDTFAPPAGAAGRRKWVQRALNSRYFAFPAGVSVKVREGHGTRRDFYRDVPGMAAHLNGVSADGQARAVASGSVPLSDATVHWWVLRDDPAVLDDHGEIHPTGHVAALYQRELYNVATRQEGTARLQQFGVLAGSRRVVLYVEPAGPVVPDASRSVLRIDGEDLPWARWAGEFARQLPEAIRDVVAESLERAGGKDRKASIAERLARYRDLFVFTRFRVSAGGRGQGGGPPERGQTATAGGRPAGTGREPAERLAPRRPSPARPTVVSLTGPGGDAADPLDLLADIDPQWQSETDCGLRGRAARYLPASGALVINEDFPVFTQMVERLVAERGEQARPVVEAVVREWYAQVLIETVLRARALGAAGAWSDDEVSEALSEVSLSAAVLQVSHIHASIRSGVAREWGRRDTDEVDDAGDAVETDAPAAA